MDTLTRHEMTVELLKAGVPTTEIDGAVTTAVSLASSGEVAPRAAVAAVVQVMVSEAVGGGTETAQVRLSEPVGEDWEMQLGAALGIEIAVLAILTPDALVAVPPTAFDLPEHPFGWDGSKVVVTRLVLDEHGNRLVRNDEGEPVNYFDFPDRPKLTTAMLHDLPAGWRVIEHTGVAAEAARYQFVQDPSYRLNPAQ